MSEKDLATTAARTAHNKAAILKLLDKDPKSIVSACQSLTIGRRTFYDWREADPEFNDKVLEIQEKVVEMVEDRLLDQIKDGNIAAIIFFLKTQGKSKGYIESQEIKHTSEDMGVQESKELAIKKAQRLLIEVGMMDDSKIVEFKEIRE